MTFMTLFGGKAFRYYYWLTIEFVKKHSKMILLSFFLSFFIVVALISFSPILNRFLFSKREIIGLVGDYDINTLPNEVLDKVSHGLVVIDEKGQLLPALASSWKMNKNAEEFTFQLKKDLVWDDGKDFRAQDLAFNFKDVEYKASSDENVQFKLKRPLPIFPTYLAKPIVRYPLHGVAGLYKVDKIKTSQGFVKEVHLSPNKEGLPLIIYKFYDSESKMISAYKTGAINKMHIFKKNIAETFLDWKNTKVTKAVDYTRVMTLFFNLKNPVLQEKDAREAISLAIPTKEMLELGEPAKGPIAPTSWAFKQSLDQPLENLDLAQKNIAKFTSTSEAKLNFITFYDYLGTASSLEENFKKIGLQTDLKLSNFEAASQFDLLLAFWQIPQDPDQYFFWHSTQTEGNITRYNNVKVDKLLEDGRGTLNVVDRKKIYADFQEVLADELPAIFLYYPYVYTVERK